MSFLKNKTILITGGTGSFGRAFLKKILKNFDDIKKIIIFSRDELKQFEMSQEIEPKKLKVIRFFIGDIRDGQRLERALDGVNYVIHAAALKQVVTSEYNPFETIKTNVMGSQNLIEACLNKSVEKVIALSTDKASSPINLYGATKLCADKLFISANNIIGKNNIKFSVLRYGNVMFSRGSIMPLLIDRYKKNENFEITDKRMTRFNIELDQAIDLSIDCLKNMHGGELFVPKLKSYNVIDLAKAISKKNKIDIIGIRPGEKLHEEMISSIDSLNTYKLRNLFVIVDPLNKKLHQKYSKFSKVKPNSSYNSFDNKDFLTPAQLVKIVKKYM